MPKVSKPNQKNWEIVLKLPNIPKDYKPNTDEIRYIILAEWYSDDISNHLKGYVQFRQKKREVAVLKHFKPLHILQAQQPETLTNKEYMDKFKKGIFREWGDQVLNSRTVRSIQARAILEEIIKDHQKRVDVNVMLRKHPLNARDVVGPLMRLRHNKRIHKPNILYLYGPTGIGKTINMERAVKLSGMDHYDKPPRIKWWHKYDQQPVVIMEEFSSCIAMETFLKICDGTGMLVESKGNLIEFNSPYIIMTSNRSPEDQYLKEKYVKDKYGNVTDTLSEQWLAYHRRINQYITNPTTTIHEDPNDPESKIVRKGYDKWEYATDTKIQAKLHQRIFREVVNFLTLPVEEFIPPEEKHSPETTKAIEAMQANAEKVKQLCQPKPLQIELCEEDYMPDEDIDDDHTEEESETD